MKTFGRLFRRQTLVSGPPEQTNGGWPFESLARSTKAFERARSAARSCLWNEAERYLLEAEADPPDRASFLMLKADVAMAQKNWALSELRWQAVIDEFPEQTHAFNAKATAIRAQGRTLEAVAAYLLAMEKDPKSLGPPSMLAHMLEHLPPGVTAELVPKLGPALDPHLKDRRNGALALWSKGKVALGSDDLLEARRLFRAAQTAALTNDDIRADVEAVEARIVSLATAADGPVS